MEELEKAYNASTVEDRIYKMWLDSEFFNPDKLPDSTTRNESFTIIMPPPNANAPLHVGHALGLTIEDILIRYHRMQGKKALWLPGTDHAGFETQVVFEKKLEKEGRSRLQMNREEFYKEVWEFVQNNKHISEDGIKRLGSSCDWSRNTFTLDPEIVKVVYETFQKMYGDGLIYRGDRICNWCPRHQTALADLETKYEEREDEFYYFKYGPFTIGTARPETKFGDKYVVVHPDDERYLEFSHGQKIELEWINGPITTTVIKDEAVDREFGTGAMTITPWHDAVDFEIAQRHKLDMEPIIDKTDKLLPIAGEFAGQRIKNARPLIVEKLKQKGLLVKTEENYKHNVQLCYKCNSVIAPTVIPQWYIAMTKPMPDDKPSLRDMAVSAVKNKEVEILSDRFEKIFMHWMDNIRDWPISRQIWWGIPIPVKYCGDCGETIIDTENTINSCTKCKSSKLEADPDTFDTWFSSGQWPYATLMSKGGNDLQKYFPTQVMETGWDILFFWVARMIMLSYYRTGQPPFKKVFLHGLVRDKDRQKMSKSKGNVVDPLGVIDTYGTDALRFALVFSTAAGNDIPLAEEKIKGMKHFGNKVWNIARFIMSNVSNRTNSFEAKTENDKAILEKLENTISVMTKDIENFRIHEAAQEIYQFAWKELADIYIEQSKQQLSDPEISKNTQAILLYQLTTVLKLLHPFMPFITEEIWQKLKENQLVDSNMLMVENWPTKLN